MSLADFHEGRFPVAAGPGSSGGPEWRTEALSLASGQEVRNARWASSRRRWELVTAPLGPGELARLVDFFNARRGRLQGFRYRDPTGHTTARGGGSPGASDEILGYGDGEENVFSLIIGGGVSVKRILKPVAGSVLIGVNGVPALSGWTLNPATGDVMFDIAPPAGAEVTAGFEYDWPVRFDTDTLDISHDQLGSGRIVSLPLIELS